MSRHVGPKAGRHGVASAAAIALGALGLVLTSPPANAAVHWDVDISCAEDVILPGQPGDTYTFTLTPACRAGGVPYVFNSLPDGDGWVTGIGFLGVPSNLSSSYNGQRSSWVFGFPLPDPADWSAAAIVGAPTFALMPLEGIELQAVNYIEEPIGSLGSAVGAVESGGGEFFTIRWGEGAESGGEGGSAVTPPDWLQQIGMPESGACADVDDADAVVYSTLKGGWAGPVWGEWMNDRRGGWACTRTLTYSGSTRGWTVR